MTLQVRKEGFYWVRFYVRGDARIEVALWTTDVVSAGAWELCGVDERNISDEGIETLSSRLEPPL